MRSLSVEKVNDLYDRNTCHLGPDFANAVLRDIGIEYAVLNKDCKLSLLSRILVIFNNVELWRNLIDTILDLTDGYYEFGEAVYTLSEDVKAAFSTWSDRNTDAVNEEADKTICEFFQKIER